MKLGIFCPGSPPRQEAMETGLAWLTEQGFGLIRAPHIRLGDGLHAGSPAERADDLHALLRDPEVDAILCARGGSGTLGLLPLLDPYVVDEHPKPIIGMSDVTALHLALYQLCELPAISGQMVVQLSPETPEDAGRTWLRLVRGPFPFGPIPLPEGSDLRAFPGRSPAVAESAEGVLLPCNLSLLTSLIGTPYLPPLRDSILVLEEIDETPQSLDRMVSRLALSGVAEGISGVVLGQFTECRARGQGVTEEEGLALLEEWTRSLGVPVLVGFPYGHEANSRALPFGARARITCNPPSLELIEKPKARKTDHARERDNPSPQGTSEACP